jgi:hypothetical protein
VRQVRQPGPGKFDAAPDAAFLTGRRRDASTGIPAWGNLHRIPAGAACLTNAFVANLEMRKGRHGRRPSSTRRAACSTAVRPRADDPDPSLQARAAGSRLSIPALTAALCAPPGPAAVFNGPPMLGRRPPLFTEPGWNLHTAEEIGIDDFQSSRSPDQRYRTTPLAGLFTRQKGGFYHDGRFANLRAVVEHYNQALNLNLGEQAKKDLIEYLKSL